MPEAFLELEAREQSQIYRALAPTMGRSPMVLEKDVWVCWVLQTLFTMPGALTMAFKGGTSLSKVFGAIARFSEDVDITLDYRGLDNTFDPFAPGVSRTRLKKFSDDLQDFVRSHVHAVVAPHFRRVFEEALPGQTIAIDVSDDGEQLRVHYPSVLDAQGGYLGSSVLVEFGGRNITEPSVRYQITPDIASQLPELEFPNPAINVLAPERTFWEKATLIHVECQRGEFRASAQRMSRHWYDMAMMADRDIGRSALGNRELLADVVRHKKVFFNASYANYDACLQGLLQLIPGKMALSALQDDYQRMIDSGMFIGQPEDFASLTERLRKLQADINKVR
jgi:hypothetical protein